MIFYTKMMIHLQEVSNNEMLFTEKSKNDTHKGERERDLGNWQNGLTKANLVQLF